MSARGVMGLGLVLVALLSPLAERVEANAPKALLPFGPGERFEYNLTALGASAGRLRLGVIDQGEYQGQRLMSLAAKLEPGGIISLFWQGEGRRTSFLHLGSLTPLRVIDVEEGPKKTFKTQFDFDGIGSVIVTRFGANKSDGSDVISKRAVPKGTLDALSGLYQLRTRAFAVGDKVELDMLDNGRMYKMQLRVDRKERMKTVLGDTEALVLVLEGHRVNAKPPARPKGAKLAETTAAGPTVASASEMVPRSTSAAEPTSQPASQPAPKLVPEIVSTVWLSSDANHLPLRFDIQVGKTSVSAELTGYTPAP